MRIASLLVIALVGVASSVAATSAPPASVVPRHQVDAELAKTQGCMACHAVDKRLSGPSFKDIAAKYAGQKDAEDKLVKRVRAGASGVWGTRPQPAMTEVNNDDLHRLVKWILKMK